MATILKSKQFPEGINRAQIEVFNWEDVATRAREYLSNVREQAEALIEAARLESESIRREAQQAGVQAGKNDIQTSAQAIAEKIASERIAVAIGQIDRLSDELEESTFQWLRQWQHEMIPLSIAIAERLVNRQIDADPAILLQWLNDAVRLIQGNQKISLRMHPKDVQTLGDNLQNTIKTLSTKQGLELVVDEGVEEQGLIIETADCSIDLQLTSQLQRLREELE